ncbi:MAG: proline dehydrogenase family protein [Flavobacteriales bacterium]|nr:proline dehydrogenase family protein [Flavobacteriales bacterium]
MINFDDTKAVFAHKSNWELRKSYYLFSILQHSFLVKIGNLLLKISFFLRIPIKKLIKMTIFNQFCGGENIQDCSRKINELYEFGIGTILDYSVEGKENESDFEKTKEEIIQTILFSSNNSKIPFTVFKITGLGKSSLIEKASLDFKNLEDKELVELNFVTNRVDEICKVAFENRVPVFIDAEDSWYQDYIDKVVESMIFKYNNEFPIVYNTIQLYRHDRLQYMKDLILRCNSNGKNLGLKLVRGAYMEKEREQASKKNYPDPIQKDKQATDNDFTKAVEFCIKNIKTVSLCVGTHNEKSVLHLTNLMKKNALKNNDSRIWFAQLLGMSDHISFNLSKEGYNVAKYVPYGPVKEVIPYLIRRAEENTSVSGQTSRELSLIKIEVERRN